MRFAVLSDTHYISKKAMYGEGGERDLLRRAINISVMEDLAGRTDIDTVLITGDLTDAGDLESHREFAELLRGLKQSGKNVYVLTATHDFHFSRAYVTVHGWPVKYRERPWERPWFDRTKAEYKKLVTEEFSSLSEADCAPGILPVAFPDDLWEIYREFGRDQAFSVCDSAYSYVVKLDEKLWCLMLNNNFRDIDANYDFSPTYSPACFRWMEGLVRQAKAEGALLFACTHHPLVPPVPAYKIGGTRRNMRGPTVCHTLADIGIPLVFSGHTHFSNVVFGQSENGNLLCNVTTPSISFLPPAWRLVDLEPQTCRLKLTTVPSAPPKDLPVKEATLREHFVREFLEDERRSFENLPHGLGKAVLGVELKHLYPLAKGAAKLTPAEYEKIKSKKLFDLIMDLAVNMQTGDGKYTPDTPEYKYMMGLSAALDSVVRAQPFYPVEKKLEGYTISQIVEPMLCKKGVPDNDAEFCFDQLPVTFDGSAAYTSHVGEILMLILSAAAALLSPCAPVLSALAIPAMTLLKKKKLERRPYAPEQY